MLGAANLRDIGFHFPDSDPKYKGIDSKKLLCETTTLLKNNGWRVGNIDATVCAERPKINPYVETMRETLAPLLDIPLDCISIKATTTERLGFTGREEGISAYAVCLIEKIQES